MATPSPRRDTSFDALPVAAKVGILVGIVALITAVYYFALHMGVTEEIRSARAARVQLQQQMREAQERNAEFVRLREQLSARAELDRANLMALPDEAEMATFLRELNREAELAGLRILLVEPRPEEPQERFIRLPVRLRLGGRYHQLARFFHSVSRLNRLISMDDIRLGEPEEQGDEVILDVEVEATTYRRPPPPEAAPPAAEGQAAAAPTEEAS
ncbi:MAG: type 4a pilus biogenesis protein PilO [Sandaracinaceae bacterium]